MKNKRELKHFLQTLAIVVVGVVLYWGLANYKVVEHWLALLFGVLTPFIIGFVLALMLNVPMSFIERNIFRPKKDGSRGKMSAKIARPVSLALTYVICAGVIVLVVALVVPSVKETVVQLSAQVPDFVVRVFNKASNNAALNSWINKAGLSADKVIATLTDKLHNSTIISDALTGTINFATDMVSGVVNFFIGLVFSVYMLAQKEKLKSQLYRTCTAFLPEKAVRRLAHVGNLSKATFSNFLSGQGLEACILGSLCALGRSSHLRRRYTDHRPPLLEAYGGGRLLRRLHPARLRQRDHPQRHLRSLPQLRLLAYAPLLRHQDDTPFPRGHGFHKAYNPARYFRYR